MNLEEAIRVLVIGPGRRFPALSTAGLRTLFHNDDDNAFRKGLRKLVGIGLIERVARGLYLNLAHPHMGFRGIGVLARRLRPRHLSYLSYEYALSQHGSISQVPMVYIIATTGRPGKHATRYGDLEFSHSNRGEAEILRGTEMDPATEMLIASPELAADDLRRIRPWNLNLIDDEMHQDAIADWERMLASPPLPERREHA
ncbi:MAG: hypothetical protein OXP09_00560 [Gammaproteobacteria bacterium]|nr:hypothetical protein [Gammaproteobacteria bacterium]MDE0364044.1 hypothetical protein [Gammaproteobacteria bacterium]